MVRLILALISVFAIALPLHAQKAAVDPAAAVAQLLALTHQPRVEEIIAAFGGTLPEINPFGYHAEKLVDLVKANGPEMIVGFEKNFPGATYAPLGRDSRFLGDVLDAFYLSLGQKDRMIPVPAR